jgi:hypothetical protein
VFFGWEVHLDANLLLKRYLLASGSSAWSTGAGGGAAASASVHLRMPAAVSESGRMTWVDFELGVGNALHYDTWKPESGKSTEMLEDETPIFAGAHFASGSMRPTAHEAVWSGWVFGVTWMPTYMAFFDGATFAAGGQLNPAGVRLTLDTGSVHRSGLELRPLIRFFFTWLPDVSRAPTALTAGVGCVFY